jgi:DNA mismatch endonuclease, patch repair protein
MPDRRSARPLYPMPASAATSVRMKANRSRDTQPEVELRSKLHRVGLRFRKNLPIKAGETRVRADIVFQRARLAVFVDGCFWHVCPEHGNVPRRNVHYWAPKLRRNVKRDAEVTAALEDQGWVVLRLWEHVPVDDAVARVLRALRDAP